jgi:NADP-dependent 3-hydroxy acid dehydrogenase YdfG
MLENNSKLAVVKGASSGVGYATSLALSKSGIRVAIGARPYGQITRDKRANCQRGEGEIFLEKTRCKLFFINRTKD